MAVKKHPTRASTAPLRRYSQRHDGPAKQRSPRSAELRFSLLAAKYFGAVGMSLVDAENAHVIGEKLQFLERQPNGTLLGMAFDVGVELGGGELPLNLVGFELDHVHAVGGKAAERLVESGGNIPYTEDEARYDRSILQRGVVRSRRENNEASGVAVIVLDVRLESFKAVDRPGKARGDGCCRRILSSGNFAGGARRIGGHDRLELELADDLAALAERMDVAADDLEVAEVRAGEAQELVTDAQK